MARKPVSAVVTRTSRKTRGWSRLSDLKATVRPSRGRAGPLRSQGRRPGPTGSPPGRLAGHEPPPRGGAGRYADPAMPYLLDALTAVPGHVMDELPAMLARTG
ncbi:hypothetical protein GCM10010254_48880 [Streptomyces chromofuscus]|nr:hypothetical protein GCM10010254_48880 [Streptomyces chromofuscus]